MTNMLKTLLVAILLLGASACKDDDHSSPQPTVKTFVLVHGSWQAPYAWAPVKALLEKQGQKVITVELPAHGDDTTSYLRVSMNAYRDKVIAAIKATNTKVILVGHSMGGMVVTEVAEAIPDQVEKLVYVAGFLPANGQSLIQLALTDAESQLGPSLVQKEGGALLEIPKEKMVGIFIADGTPAVQQTVLDNYRDEPGIPYGDAATLTADHFGKVDKYYIRTLKDQAIGNQLQQRMITAAGITKTFSLSTSHCPFLSQPDSVANLLLQISK